MPAQANQKVMQDEAASVQVELFEVYDVVLYLGIIDILQEYNMKKKLEHTYKSLKFDPMSISAIEPKIYSKRFLSFLEKVFPVEPWKVFNIYLANIFPLSSWMEKKKKTFSWFIEEQFYHHSSVPLLMYHLVYLYSWLNTTVL